MAKVTKLTHERLTEVLDYDPGAGFFRWKVRSSNRVQIGDRAGVVGTNGHRFITIDREKLQASRLAWFYVHRSWPTGDIKFADNDADNCALSNLRDMSRVDLARQRGMVETNTSGYRGVSRAKHGRWQAKITWNYQQINLGASFETAEDASEMYEEASRRLVPGSDRELVLSELKTWRRQRTVWNHLNRHFSANAWQSFEHFCQTVTEYPEARYAMVPIDMAKPIGPSNYRWTMPIDAKGGLAGSAYHAAVREAKQDQIRDREFRKKYGIGLAEYKEMLAAQDGVCASCRRPETKVQFGTVRMLSVDHDHDTGKVRGLLCGNCNAGIGYFGNDEPELLRAAADYLDRYYGRDGLSRFASWLEDKPSLGVH